MYEGLNEEGAAGARTRIVVVHEKSVLDGKVSDEAGQQANQVAEEVKVTVQQILLQIIDSRDLLTDRLAVDLDKHVRFHRNDRFMIQSVGVRKKKIRGI